MHDDRRREIPTYTKIGFRLTLALLLIISIFLLRNCVQAVRDGASTPAPTVEQMYDQGFEDGRRKALGLAPGTPYEGDNLVLHKAYRRGFRAGWDAGNKEGDRRR